MALGKLASFIKCFKGRKNYGEKVTKVAKCFLRLVNKSRKSQENSKTKMSREFKVASSCKQGKSDLNISCFMLNKKLPY